MYATPKQIALITKLVAERGQSEIAACEQFGLGLKAARDLTKFDASQFIDWLLGKPIDAGVDRASATYRDAADKARADAAEFERKYGR